MATSDTDKDVPGRGLFSRMARLVGQEHSDEADDLERQERLALDTKALREAADRRRLNDKVRRKEFAVLRDAVYRRRAQIGLGSHDMTGQSQAEVSGSPSEVQSGLDTRAHTIEQIERIEAQMSQLWLDQNEANASPRHTIRAPQAITGPIDGGLTVPTHLQAQVRRHFSQTVPLELALVEGTKVPVTMPETDVLSQALSDPAVLHAKGDEAGTERALRSLMAQGGRSPTAKSAWLALLDWRCTQGDVARFEDVAIESAEQFRSPVPRWPSQGEAAAAPAVPGEHDKGPVLVWRSPAFLDVAAVQQLQAVVERALDAPVWLDWVELVSCELDAAKALRTLAERWAQLALDFKVCGGGVLRRRLKASTPSGRCENDAIWWMLRLALLRIVGSSEEFDLVALDYCVTYDELPPMWAAPKCRCVQVESLPVAAKASAGSTGLAGDVPVLMPDWPADRMAHATASSVLPRELPRLAGVLQGGSDAVLADLQAALERHPEGEVFAIDCGALVRIDFVAASALLQWVVSTVGKGVRIELRTVSRLVAAFFRVVGIDEVVTMRLRQY